MKHPHPLHLFLFRLCVGIPLFFSNPPSLSSSISDRSFLAVTSLVRAPLSCGICEGFSSGKLRPAAQPLCAHGEQLPPSPPLRSSMRRSESPKNELQPIKRVRDEAVEPAIYEQAHVHDVYNAIADHFSATRYKAWPRIRAFLEALPPHTMIADVGCGNGKYFACAQRLRQPAKEAETISNDPKESAAEEALSVPTHRYLIGMDYSEPLLRLTQRTVADPNFDVSTSNSASAVNAGVRPGVVLFSRRRRVRRRSAPPPQALEALPRTDTIRCDAQFCPLRGGVFDAVISIAVIHHYASHERRVRATRELLRLAREDGGLVLLYVWALEQPQKAGRLVDAATGDALVRWEMNGKFDAEKRSFDRYYHLFRKGELESLVEEAACGLAYHIRDAFYDTENWCVVVEREPGQTGGPEGAA